MGNVIDAVRKFQANDEVGAALQQVLESNEFRKSLRLSSLLAFLVDKKLAGSVRETSEYAIGIDVFGRDPAIYSTCADPIVRVQVGRLREKLKKFYATEGAGSSLCFSIPLGSYMPNIHVREQGAPPQAARRLLALRPLALLGDGKASPASVRCLDEELSHQLYKTFGPIVVVPATDRAAAPVGRAAFSHCLEGSVRVWGSASRTSLRLIDSLADSVAWSAQFDHDLPSSIGQHEELASAMCAALALYFAHAPA